MHMYICNFTRY